MIYQIKVQGEVDPSWSDWFNELHISTEPGDDCAAVTTLRGDVCDQSGLRGILNRLWDLNLTVLSVLRLDSTGPAGEIRSIAGEGSKP